MYMLYIYIAIAYIIFLNIFNINFSYVFRMLAHSSDRKAVFITEY